MSSDENGKRTNPVDQIERLEEREEDVENDEEGDGDEDAYESNITPSQSRYGTHKQMPSSSSSLPSLPKSAAAASVLQEQQHHLHHQQSSPAATSLHSSTSTSPARPHSSGVTGTAVAAAASLSAIHRPAAKVSPVPFGRFSSFSGSSSNSSATGITSRNTDDSGFASGHFDTVSHGSVDRLMEGQQPISSISAAGTLAYQLENPGSASSLSAYGSGNAAAEAASGSAINPILAKEARTRSFLVGNLGCQVRHFVPHNIPLCIHFSCNYVRVLFFLPSTYIF